jgi:hypothetical protein
MASLVEKVPGSKSSRIGLKQVNLSLNQRTEDLIDAIVLALCIKLEKEITIEIPSRTNQTIEIPIAAIIMIWIACTVEIIAMNILKNIAKPRTVISNSKTITCENTSDINETIIRI